MTEGEPQRSTHVEASQEEPSNATFQHGQRIVLRNASILMLAQFIAMPIGVVVNAAMGRFLGPSDLGRLYLASTFTNFAFLFVVWGQTGTLPALVAQNRSRAPDLLGSALAWRVPVSVGVVTLLATGALYIGDDARFALTLALCGLVGCINAIWAACVEVIRGFERSEAMAYAQVGGPLFGGVLVITALSFGGTLETVLLIQALTAVIVLAIIWKALRSIGVRSIATSRATVRELMASGLPFLVFAITMELQPSIDAMYMSRLVPDEVVGWLSAARRLLGVLVQPASVIIVALYPTLCRLFAENKAAYARAGAQALHGTSLLAVPLAVGAAFFPDIGISIFGRAEFGPAEDNIRVMSLFVFLVYLSMPLGSILLAGGKQRIWSAVQGLCILFSLVLDPLLIPWFQRRNGNGGLGVAVAGVIGEAFMVGLGLWLVPSGILTRRLLKQFAVLVLAGFAMAVAAIVLRPFLGWAGAPVSAAVYLAVAWRGGGLDRELLATIRDAARRKLRRS